MVLTDTDYKSVNNNKKWEVPMDPVTSVVLSTVTVKGASTRSSLKEYTEHTNSLLQHKHNVCQHEKKKTKYKKYQAGLTALRNLIARNIKE